MSFTIIRTKREGSVLITVIMVASMMLMAGMALAFLTSQSVISARRIHDGGCALSIAEAGVSDCLMRMSTNYLYWQNKSFSNSYADGTYLVSTVVDSNTFSTIITSTGSLNKDRRTTILEILGTIYDRYNAVLGVDGCIVAGGNVTLETSALTINGDIHCNGSILNSTGNPGVNGNVSACGTIAINAAGTEMPNAAPITVPTYLPFDEWEALAKTNGLYYSSSLAAGGYDFRPSNGVVYVNGDVEIGNRSSLVGTLVASGTITINNRFDQTPFNTNWPSMLAGIDLNENNLNSYYGVMFAGNNVTLENRRYCYGAIIALNNVTIKNASTLDPLGRFPQWSPSSTSAVTPQIVYGGWLQ